MAKVTSELQVTVPKAILPAGRRSAVLDPTEGLRLFDMGTARQRQRQRGRRFVKTRARGWTREELYERGRAR